MIQYNGNYTDENGRPVKGAQVFVYTSEGVTAAIFDTNGNAIAQPLLTDEDGNFSYRAEEGYFRHQVWVGKRRVLIENEVILGPSYRDAAQTAASAALAAAGVGEYADTGAGLAATEEGQTFWVDNGDGTGTTYRHDPGPVATAIGKFIKDPTGNGAANLIGKAGGGTVQAYFDDLAADTGLSEIGSPDFASARAEMDSKGPVATKSAAIDAGLYPVDFRLGRDHSPHPFEFVPAPQHNAIIAGGSTYDCSGDLQAMLDGWNTVDGKAGIEDFPVGRFALGQPLLFPNWISWRGMERGTQLFILPDHTGPYAFQFDSDPEKVHNGPDPDWPSSQFNQRLEGFDINANGENSLNVEWLIYAPSWNEQCGLRNLVARNVRQGFLFIDEWHGGSSGFTIRDVEVHMAASSYNLGKTVIRFLGRLRSGDLIAHRPQVTLQGVSIAGAISPNDPDNPGANLTLIEADNVDLDFDGSVHFERALYGLIVDHGAFVIGHSLSGSDTGGSVQNLVARGTNHTGQIDLYTKPGQGTEKALRDFKTGIDITDPVGGRICVPALPGQAWASGRFSVGAGPAVTSSDLYGCSSVIRDGAAGYYRVTFADTMVSGANYSVVAEAHDDTACYAVSHASERAGATFHIRVLRQSDDTAFDPSEVTFRVHRKPGL